MQKRFLGLTTVGAIAALSTILISSAQAGQIIDIETAPTDRGLTLDLTLQQTDPVTVLQTRFGTTIVLDLLVTQLAEGVDFSQDAPIDGIDSVSVQPLDANSVRIRIVGSSRRPRVTVNQDDTGIAINVTQPRSISCRNCPRPNYPEAALEAGIEGEVRLRIEFDAEGSVIRANVTRSSGSVLLDQAALEAMLNSEFDVNGVSGSIDIEIPFVIEGEFRHRQEPQ